MRETIPAVFENGVFRPLRRLSGLVEHHQVTLTVDVEEQVSAFAPVVGELRYGALNSRKAAENPTPDQALGEHAASKLSRKSAPSYSSLSAHLAASGSRRIGHGRPFVRRPARGDYEGALTAAPRTRRCRVRQVSGGQIDEIRRGLAAAHT